MPPHEPLVVLCGRGLRDEVADGHRQRCRLAAGHGGRCKLEWVFVSETGDRTQRTLDPAERAAGERAT